MMILELTDLTHRYGDELAIDGVSFGLESGEILGLLGPSGCGKTTIVQAIAGHLSPTDGRVLLRGTDVTNVAPESRNVSVVFQQPTLYPHMTVSENVAYGLAPRDIDDERQNALTAEYLDLVDLQAQSDSSPDALSGGQKRRVELARALAPQPDILLLDEPLSGLDPTLRQRLRDEIVRIQDETGVTTLFVTHSQEDAMALADRLVILNDGSVEGVDTPRRLYESPPTPFVASFLGRSNTVSATVSNDDPLRIDLAGEKVTPAESPFDCSSGDRVTCHVRPTDLSLSSAEPESKAFSITGTVARAIDLGKRYDVTVRMQDGTELVVECTESPPAAGERVTVTVSENSLTVFCQ